MQSLIHCSARLQASLRALCKLGVTIPSLLFLLSCRRAHARPALPRPQVIDQAELQRRMDAARDSGEQHFYIMELGPGLFIDAKRKGNHARLLNSSCDPNCETQKW